MQVPQRNLSDNLGFVRGSPGYVGRTRVAMFFLPIYWCLLSMDINCWFGWLLSRWVQVDHQFLLMVPSKKWRCQKVGAPKRIWQCLKLERHSPCPNALTRCLKIKRPLPFAASRTKRFWQCLKLERHLPSANVLRQHSPLDALPCEPGSVAAKGLPSVPDLIHEDAGRGSAKERQGGILLVSWRWLGLADVSIEIAQCASLWWRDI